LAKKQISSTQDGSAILRADIKSGSIGTFYIFYGEEAYLRTYYLDQLRSKLMEGPAEAFNFHRFDAKSFSANALQDAVDALPVMAERTMIQIDDLDLSKLDESTREMMTQIILDLPEYVCLVLVYDVVEYKLDKRQKKFADAVQKTATELNFQKQSQASLTDWCIRHFRSAGKRINNDLCAYLIFQTGGTMTALKPEIEKIAAFAAGDEITRQDIDAVVIPVLDAQVFQITDELASRNFAGALSRLQVIFQMQEEPIPVLAAIASNLRRLLAAKTLSENGKGSDELMKLCSMSDYPARKTMSNARNFTMQWCRQAVLLCAETDYKLKTSYDDAERLVELLILRLSEEAKHA